MSDYNENTLKIIGSTLYVVKAFGLDVSGQVIDIQNSGSMVLDWLDKYSGIDWIMKRNDDHVFGIAARIQLTQPKYYLDPQNTFTIRYETVSGGKTEYEKRIESIENGYFYPLFTLQAYVKEKDPTHVLSGAMMKTIDLYDFMKKYSYLVNEDRRDNVFKIVKWTDVKRNGYMMHSFGV